MNRRELLQKLGGTTAVAGVVAATTKKNVVAQGAMAEQKTVLSAAVPRPDSLPTPTTNVGQAMVSIGNYTYLFAVDTDGRILYTFWPLGGAGQGWYEVGGGGRTDAAPAVAAVGNYIWITIKGLDGRIYLNQGTPPNWVGWQTG